MKLLVQRVDHPAEGVLVAELVSPTGAALPAWEAGAHVDLILPSGIIRQYSLCGDPADESRYRIGILREEAGRGGSIEAHAVLRTGAEVEVSAPRNHFPIEAADGYVLVGGGIGVTPLIAMSKALTAAGKPWQMIYGGRARHTMGFLDELSPLETVWLVPQDEAGFIDLAAVFDTLPEGHLVYACGPEPMLQAIEAAAAAAGKAAQLRLERFGAPEGLTQETSAAGYEVELRQSGVTLHVGAGESLREVLIGNGISVSFSCEEGYCGSCETAVLEGEPIHNDVVLTEEERASNTLMMVCCGSCKSPRLVLDL